MALRAEPPPAVRECACMAGKDMLEYGPGSRSAALKGKDKEVGMAPQPAFDPRTFLGKVGAGRTLVACPQQHPIFTQGKAANAMFYIRDGQVKLTVLAPQTFFGLLRVSFEPMSDVVPPPQAAARGRTRTTPRGRVAELERELQQSRDAWQKTVEELAAAQAEFKLTSEEMRATNEELQSANEELETTREELQSLNEELETVNTELRSKVDALSEAQDDMANLLDSIDIAAIFLDNDLCIKRFTTQATRVSASFTQMLGGP